nr:hypothetical protein [Tanacetum cinerariifolium]
RGDNDANDDGDDFSEDDADDEDEEESSDSEEEEEEHLALTVPDPALYSSVSTSEETEPFEEGETAAIPPPFGYRVASRISKMAPKRARTTRANPDPTRTTTATKPMIQEAINNLIAQRVVEAIAEYETQRNGVVNGDTSNTTGTGPRTVKGMDITSYTLRFQELTLLCGKIFPEESVEIE